MAHLNQSVKREVLSTYKNHAFVDAELCFVGACGYADYRCLKCGLEVGSGEHLSFPCLGQITCTTCGGFKKENEFCSNSYHLIKED